MSSWAQRGKEALAAVSAVPEGMEVRNSKTDLEPIEFYCYSTPRNPASKSIVFEPGQNATGIYEGSVVEKDGQGNPVKTELGQTKYRFHKIRVEGDKVPLKGFSSCAALNNELPKIPNGTKVYLERLPNGMTKTGKNAGKPQNTFKIAY
jgi:hypothetical protein